MLADVVVVDKDGGDQDWLILWYQYSDNPWNYLDFKILPPIEKNLQPRRYQDLEYSDHGNQNYYININLNALNINQ